MSLDDLLKPNLAVLLGLGAASLVLPRFAPAMRPALVAAIRAGITLFGESEAEAEAELIRAMVGATLDALQRDLAAPASEPVRRERVRQRVHHFKRQAHKRARRWSADEPGHQRCYRRYIAGIEAGLARRKQLADDESQAIIDEAFAELVEAY